VLLVGTGTSWHAAGHGASLLRLAGVEAWPLAALDVALDGPVADPARDALIVLSHTGAKRYSARVLAQARAAGVPTVAIGGIGAPGVDLETVELERSDTYTASHLGALLRLAQIAAALGAPLGGALDAVPAAVAQALTEQREAVAAPARLLELVGGGSNAWTAAEGALKVREAAYVATEGLPVEQYVHGPSVAVGPRDALVVLDGGGPWSARLDEAAAATAAAGARVHRVTATALGEPLSIFPLTAAVQRIALELSEALGTDPDTFGAELPGHDRWASLEY
jgi:glucosamine--fructose-6-phosphate aminotransferase (isomerizing)